MEPEISVVIPTYNRAKTLRRAIESVIEQSAQACAIIVVDDGSIDGTKAVVEEFSNRIAYLHQANAGVALARKAGVAYARTEWVAFLDSDDYWLSGHLEGICQCIRQTAGLADVYFSNAILESPSGNVTWWGKHHFEPAGSCDLRVDATEWVLGKRGHPMLIPASVIRRECFLKCTEITSNLKVRSDTLLFYKLGMQYAMCAVSMSGVVVTDDGGERLTALHDRRSPVFLEVTAAMYEEILATVKPIQRLHREIIESRLSNCYLQSSVHNFRRGRIVAGTKSAVRCVSLRPLGSLLAVGKKFWAAATKSL